MNKTPAPRPDSASAENKGAPIGHGSPDEPANTLPAEPVTVTKVAAAVDDGKAASAAGKADQKQGSATEKRRGNEEPEPTLEEDLPSDGRDEKGEAMIRDLPRNTGLPASGDRKPKES